MLIILPHSIYIYSTTIFLLSIVFIELESTASLSTVRSCIMTSMSFYIYKKRRSMSRLQGSPGEHRSSDTHDLSIERAKTRYSDGRLDITLNGGSSAEVNLPVSLDHLNKWKRRMSNLLWGTVLRLRGISSSCLRPAYATVSAVSRELRAELDRATRRQIRQNSVSFLIVNGTIGLYKKKRAHAGCIYI